MTHDHLTFSEAMALDPSEVEVEISCGSVPDQRWFTVAAAGDTVALSLLRKSTFRLARPKRSRVQEMAVHFDNNRANETTVDTMTEVIRAVCEYLRKEGAYYSSDKVAAERIERHFLEPF